MPLGTASFPIASPVDGRFPGYYRGLYGSPGTVTGALTLSCLGLPEVMQEAGTDCLPVDFGSDAQLHFSTLAMDGAHLVQWRDGCAVFSLSAPEPSSSALLLTAPAACMLRRRKLVPRRGDNFLTDGRWSVE